MSRGYGRLQRRLVEILEGSDTTLDTFDLVARAFDYEAGEDGIIRLTDAQLASGRRALKKLAKEGRIFDLGRRFQLGRSRWANERVGLRYTIRKMQMENVQIAATGDEAAFKTRVAEMLPLLERASELNVDLS